MSSYENNGVTQWYRNTLDGVEIYDIEIADDVQILRLGSLWVGAGMVYYHLREAFRCFPNVKTIAIDQDVKEIMISNFMFPNVRNVISRSSYFESDSFLIYSKYGQKTLLNTFCRREYEPLSLTEYSGLAIGEYAMEGCRSTEVLWDDNCSLHVTEGPSFSGMSFTIAPMDDGVVAFDGKLLMVDQDTEEVVIPRHVHSIMTVDLNYPVDRLKICREEQCLLVQYLKVNTLILDGPLSLEGFTFYRSVARYEVMNNPWYMTEDGIIYSQNYTRLVHFPDARTGFFAVPEGVSIICDNAFYCCALEEVEIPDSVVMIGASAFFGSDITDIDFGHNVHEIGASAFGFTKLTEVDIPASVATIGMYAFSYCKSLREVTLHEGLVHIRRGAFECCDDLHSITLPKSVYRCDEESLAGIEDIRVHDEVLPVNFVEAVCMDKESYNNRLFTLHYGNESVTLPMYANQSFKKKGYRLVDQFFSQTTRDSLPYMVESPVIRQDLMIRYFEDFSLTKQEEYSALLRKNGKKIFIRLAADRNEDMLIRFVKINVLSKTCLAGYVQYLPDDMPRARAVIMDSLRNSGSKSFGL